VPKWVVGGCEEERRIASVLAVTTGCWDPEPVVGEAVRLAEEHHASLAVLVVVPTALLSVSPQIGVPCATAGEDLRKAACDRAIDQVPACVPVTAIVRNGLVLPAVLGELRRARYDAVVLGTRGLCGLPTAGALVRYVLPRRGVRALAVS